jgi:hypothetical protein
MKDRGKEETMVDNLNPTNQFHPYQPVNDIPNADREQGGLGGMMNKMGSMDMNETLGKLRSYAQANPGKVLAGLAAVVIGLGLLRRR